MSQSEEDLSDATGPTVVLLNNRDGEVLHQSRAATAAKDAAAVTELELSASGEHPGRRHEARRDTGPLMGGGGGSQWCGLLPVVAACMAALGGVLFGYDAGIVSGALLQLRDEFNLSCFQQEMIVSSLMIGAILASLTGGYLIDYFGRRPTIIVNACVFIVGAIILAVSHHYTVLIVGRLVVGFAVSLSATAECVYISEISPPKRRGFLVSLNELGITLGFLSAYLINFTLIKHHNGWRYMFGLSAIPAVVQGLAMLCLPESPRYLMIKNKPQQAAEVLNKLHGSHGVEAELEAIKVSLSDEKAQTTCDLFKSGDNMRTRMLISLGLVFLQQFTGQPSVLYYAPTVFQAIGFHSNDAATLATVGLGTVKVLSTMVAILCIDKVGRRKFLLFGASLMAVSILCLGGLIQSTGHHHARATCDVDRASPRQNASDIIIQTTPQSIRIHSKTLGSYDRLLSQRRRREIDFLAPTVILNKSVNSSSSQRGSQGEASVLSQSSLVIKWGSFVTLTLYVAGYALSFGPGSWLILSEIFPSAVKGRAISLATTVNWGTNLIVSFTFLDLMNGLGVGGTFIFYGAVCVAAVCFIFCAVPETKGKSLEQISQELNDRSALQRLQGYCRCGDCLHSNSSSYQRVEN